MRELENLTLFSINLNSVDFKLFENLYRGVGGAGASSPAPAEVRPALLCPAPPLGSGLRRVWRRGLAALGPQDGRERGCRSARRQREGRSLRGAEEALRGRAGSLGDAFPSRRRRDDRRGLPQALRAGGERVWVAAWLEGPEVAKGVRARRRHRSRGRSAPGGASPVDTGRGKPSAQGRGSLAVRPRRLPGLRDGSHGTPERVTRTRRGRKNRGPSVLVPFRLTSDEPHGRRGGLRGREGAEDRWRSVLVVSWLASNQRGSPSTSWD